MEIIIFFVISLVIILVGLAGVILPFLPGLPLAWLGFFIFALVTDFEKVSLTAALVFLGLTLLSFALDFLIPLIGAKKYKASKYGMWGSSFGLIIGTIFFNIPGIIIGPLVGAIIGELISKKTPEQAVKSAWGVFLGLMASSLFKVIVILIMLGFLIISII